MRDRTNEVDYEAAVGAAAGVMAEVGHAVWEVPRHIMAHVAEEGVAGVDVRVAEAKDGRVAAACGRQEAGAGDDGKDE